MKPRLFVPVFIFFTFSFFHCLVLAQVPVAQQASGQESLRQLEEKDQKLREKIEKPKSITEPISDTEKVSTPEAPNTEKVLINTIHVTGNTILSDSEIKVLSSLGRKSWA